MENERPNVNLQWRLGNEAVQVHTHAMLCAHYMDNSTAAASSLVGTSFEIMQLLAALFVSVSETLDITPLDLIRELAAHGFRMGDSKSMEDFGDKSSSSTR